MKMHGPILMAYIQTHSSRESLCELRECARPCEEYRRLMALMIHALQSDMTPQLNGGTKLAPGVATAEPLSFAYHVFFCQYLFKSDLHGRHTRPSEPD
jgi:hypothetical protein